MRLRLLGASRAGIGIAGAAFRAGLGSAGVWSRSSGREDRPRPEDYGQMTIPWSAVAAPGAEILIIAVRDDVIAALASRLAEDAAGLRDSGTVVVHLSGSLDRSALEALSAVGVATAALHPMRSFPRPDPGLDLSGTWFARERGGEGAERIATLVAALGGRLLEIDGAGKGAHHLACVLASNALNVLLEAVDHLRREAGADEEARAAYAALARQAVASWRELGPAALTGPWLRDDVGTLRRHLELAAGRPELLALYLSLARSALAGRPDLPGLEGVRAALRGET